jgi:hypothetical protein
MKYKVTPGRFGLRWRVQLEEGKWTRLTEEKPAMNYLNRHGLILANEEAIFDDDENPHEFQLIVNAIEFAKEKFQKRISGNQSRPWTPDERGGNYFVGIDEGAGFSESDTLSFVGTSGLIGCCALMVSGLVDGQYRVYVSHVSSILKDNKNQRQEEFMRLSDDLCEWFLHADSVKAYLVSNKEEDPHGIDEELDIENTDSPLYALNEVVDSIEIEKITDGVGTIYFDMVSHRPSIELDSRKLVNELTDEVGHGQHLPPFGHNPNETIRPKGSNSLRL